MIEKPTNLRRQLFVFTLDDGRYALPLADVERVARVVEITPLPKAPEIVLGVINVRGQIIPVVNVRRRFRLPERDLELNDQLILAHTSTRAVALLADSVAGLVEISVSQVVDGEAILPSLQYVAGVAKLPDGLILIHDLDRFLALEEQRALEQAMSETR